MWLKNSANVTYFHLAEQLHISSFKSCRRLWMTASKHCPSIPPTPEHMDDWGIFYEMMIVSSCDCVFSGGFFSCRYVYSSLNKLEESKDCFKKVRICVFNPFLVLARTKALICCCWLVLYVRITKYTRNTHTQSMPRAEEYPEICK